MSGRQRRAVALMLVAVVAVAGISLYYLRPWTALRSGLTSRPVSLVPTPAVGHIINFDFVGTALGWSVVTTYDEINNSQTGSYWLYKTVDAGKHWRRQLAGTTARLFLTYSSLWFADASTGYVVAGDPVRLYRTHDGGDHWTESELPVSDVQKLQFVDASSAFALLTTPDEATLYWTRDGGDTWKVLPPQPTNRGFWPQFQSPSEGWTGWQDVTPSIYLSIDGGISWQRRSLPATSKAPALYGTSVLVVVGGLVLADVATLGPDATENPPLYRSTDSGKTWTRVNLPETDLGAMGITVADTVHWWTIQNSTLFRTEDAGISWTRVSAVREDLRVLAIIDSLHAWAQLDTQNDHHELMLTSDGGVSWDRVETPPVG